jgi:hypothetical protein
MLLLTIISALVGATLALRFKIIILIPAIMPLIGVVVVAGIVQSEPVWQMLLTICAACMSIQMGYILGLGIRRFLEAHLAQRPATFRPDASAHRSIH